MNPNDNRAAEINAIGNPLNASGISLVSSIRIRTKEKIQIANVKPIAVKTALKNEVQK